MNQRVATPDCGLLSVRSWTVFLGLLVSTAICGICMAADWATYRADTARSGITSETLGYELFAQWKYVPSHPPKPAWPMPSEELPRMHNDNAHHVVMADGNAYFGSGVTNRVCSIDVASGELRWTFSTQGPVRFAPAVCGGRVYVGSDDGYVYCLDCEDGTLVWKYRAGPSDGKVIGNGRMISLWPVRTSVLVDREVAYFAAGVFPYEGLYVCALNAEDGVVVWKNDTIGDRAHELEFGGISPHGYLLASQDVLYVPSGRSMPAAFDRKTGKFLFCASPGGKRGGTWALVDQDRLISGVDYSGTPHKVAYDAKSGRRQGDIFAWFPGMDMVLTSDFSYILGRDGVYAINRAAYANATKEVAKRASTRKRLGNEIASLRGELKSADEARRGEMNQRIDDLTRKIASLTAEEQQLKKSSYDWHYRQKNLSSLILAGNVVLAGGQEEVIGLDAKTGKELWSNSVEGTAVALAASDGHLIVSTDKGPIYCFAKSKVAAVKEIRPKAETELYPNDELRTTYGEAAERILADSGVKKGYCLVLDCGVGRLACELAKRTELKIVGLEKDPATLQTARDNLEAAGLLGARAVVEPWDIEDLPDYFANLIVSDGLMMTGQTAATREEGYRLLRPYGGVACLGFPEGDEITWRKFVREPLKGAGNWTQQYCDPQNTACSGDELVNGPLGILWFGEPGPRGMVERHACAQSPVSMDGRLFIEGEDLIMAVDAYNGTLLWKREIPGAVRVKIKADSGNLAVTKDGLYVAAYDKCYRLDPSTGRTMRTYTMPRSPDGSPRRWGYISVVGNILYGSTAKAMDEEYGDVLRRYLKDGRWRDIDDIPQEDRKGYEQYKNLYPDPVDVRRAAERSGTMYRYMTSFGAGGEFTQRNAVTKNLMTSDKIFATDTETGELLWLHKGKMIANITVALGDGKIFFAESQVTDGQRQRALRNRKKLIGAGIYGERAGVLAELTARKKQLAEYTKQKKSFDKRTLTYLISSLEAELFKEEVAEGSLTYNDADVRVVFALDAVTGKNIWRRPVDLTGCCGDKTGAAYSDGTLLFFGNHGNHDAWRFRAGGMKWRRITALSAQSGDMLWSRPLNYRTRPVIVDDKIILEPRACELRTGETIMREHPVTGEQVPWEFLRPGHTCGTTAASADGLFYRSACTAFYDLEKDRGVTIFGGYRPGCAISVIPACGVLLSPEAAAGCTCSYPIKCTMALTRKTARAQPWTVYVTPGELVPVKHFAVNLGAIADMKDDEGTVWFGYPNPKTGSYTHFPNYGVKFDLKDKSLPGMGYFCSDFKGVDIGGTDRPWLFSSGCLGLQRLEVPLVDDNADMQTNTYIVRLGFKALPTDVRGRRVFDAKLQGNVVLKDFDILDAAGRVDTAVVKEFTGIRAGRNLVIELIPKSTNPQSDQAPIVNFVEVIRQDTAEEPEIARAGMR
ncbi:MAG: PQQ-binding-like beta-propeller repeat protein [Phycisphaerales bacterium]|nr:MAG: PQQ-binding-like beta-propeller repeat protein [Phycisphaerales bacterium]